MSHLEVAALNLDGKSRQAHIGKRSRSASVSSATSSSSGSQDGNSVFSQTHAAPSVDSASSCSSPYTDDRKLSPPSVHEDLQRPHKAIRIQCKDSDADESSSHDSGEISDTQSLSPPSSIPENACKTLFVDCLVDASVHVLNMIWRAPVAKSVAFLKNSQTPSLLSSKDLSQSCQCPIGAALAGGIPLNLFVRETLRRSRTSCSTLQAALMYCKRLGNTIVRQRADREVFPLSSDDLEVLDRESSPNNLTSGQQSRAQVASLLCSRRAFLASIMISSKFLQDRTFSNRAWSKISGLSIQELGLIEREMLNAIGFDLNVDDKNWQSWTRYLKGEWRLNFSNCHCKTSEKGETRKATLERSTSAFHAASAADMQATPSKDVDDDSISASETAIGQQHHEPPPPFPMRKDFNHRSISAR